MCTAGADIYLRMARLSLSLMKPNPYLQAALKVSNIVAVFFLQLDTLDIVIENSISLKTTDMAEMSIMQEAQHRPLVGN